MGLSLCSIICGWGIHWYAFGLGFLSALRAFWQCNQYPQLRLLLHQNFERYFKRMISIKSHECTFASLDEVDYIVTHVDRLIYWHCGHAVSLEQCRGKVYYSLD